MNVSRLPFFQHVKFRPDNVELRRFAIAMLSGFALLGLLALWRTANLGRGTLVPWSIGLAIAVAALVPGLGRAVYLAVYLPSSFVGYIVSHLILFAIFLAVFVPLGILLRLMGKDLLRLRPSGKRATWTSVESKKNADSYYHQF